MVAIVMPNQRAKVETFVGSTPKVSFRLSYDITEALNQVFTAAEADAGLKTNWWSDVDFMCGVGDGGERIHMFDAEAWCDRKGVFNATGKASKINRCRAALLILAETERLDAIGILRRMYGEVAAIDRFNSSLLGELAPLAELTKIVIEGAESLEAERQQDAMAKFEKFWSDESGSSADYEKRGCEHLKKGKPTGFCLIEEHARFSQDKAKAHTKRKVHLNRIITSAPLDTARVIREALDTRVQPKENEAKSAYAERQLRKRGERVEFISKVTSQSDKLLADASLAYMDAWKELRPSHGESRQ